MVMVLWLEQTSQCKSSWFKSRVVGEPESKGNYIYIYDINLEKNYFKTFAAPHLLMESVCWLVVTSTHWGWIWTLTSIAAFPKPTCFQPLDHHGFYNECGILGWLVVCNSNLMEVTVGFEHRTPRLKQNPLSPEPPNLTCWWSVLD